MTRSSQLTADAIVDRILENVVGAHASMAIP
jgi:hypothetical protein